MTWCNVLFLHLLDDFVLPIPTWLDVSKTINTSAATTFTFTSMLHYYQRLSCCSPIKQQKHPRKWTVELSEDTMAYWFRGLCLTEVVGWGGFLMSRTFKNNCWDCLKRTKAETMVDCGCETCCSFDNGDMLYRRWIGWSSLHMNINTY